MDSTTDSSGNSKAEDSEKGSSSNIGGIPKAVFVVSNSCIFPFNAHHSTSQFIMKEDVDAFMKEPGNSTAEVVMKRFDELYRKYKFMEANLIQKKKRFVAPSSFPNYSCTLRANLAI